MSDQDRPGNPFGRGERTIIRPNPGGRAPAPSPRPAPSTPTPTPSAPASTPQAPSSPSPAPSGPASAAVPTPAARPPPDAAASTAHAAEDWIKGTAPPPPSPQSLEGYGPVLRVDELVAPNANPIMRAAGPLLQLLGRLRVALLRASFAGLMEQVAEAIKFFEKDIRSAGIPEQQATNAKYILCATADDIVQHIPAEERHVWAQYSMLSRFFGERIGGVRFFDLLNNAKLDPTINYPLLELQHACLALGFQGVYRTQNGGAMALQQVQRELYETLRRIRPKVAKDLSPHWRGQDLGLGATRTRVPVWAIGAFAAALLFGVFVTLRLLLGGSADAAVQATATLHPEDQIALKRKVYVPPPPPPPPPPPTSQISRLREELQNGECNVVDQTANQIVIRLCDQVTFDPGQAIIKDQFKPIAAKLAAILDKEPGRIRIVGHTDNTPMKTVRFPSNWHLSLERAKAVAALIKQNLTDPSRIDVEGKGSDTPIASNTAPEGRAKNRRVEVMIGRTSE
jgi:type VI secretion system protein ImpK